MYGKNCVVVNMFWYGDFKFIVYIMIIKFGGKGGKIKIKNIIYIYLVFLMFGLCENKIKDIGIIWCDKE